MITPVNTWNLVNYNWPIDTRLPKNSAAVPLPNYYIFHHRDILYQHVLGGKWNLFSSYVPSSIVNTKA